MTKRKILFRIGSTAYFIFCLIYLNLLQAQSESPDKKWEILTEVYILFPVISGETGVGNTVTVPVDAGPDDIFSNLKFAGMLYVEARSEKWAITSDFVYMDLRQEVTPGDFWNSGTLGVKQLIWEPAGLYRLTPFLDIGVGGRLNNVQASAEGRRNVFPIGTEEVASSFSKTWFDPIVIARLTGDIQDKWLFLLRGDIGGFGLGSNFTWQIQAYAGYRFSKLFQITAGYRVLGIDYDKGDDQDRFVFNMTESGPVIRFGFNF